jgi:putative intracellular protease/amidase
MPVSADRPLAVLLNNDFADWEAGFLTASVRDFFDTDVLYFSPDGKKVKSEGGLTVKPDGAFDDVTPEKHRAIVVCGSGAWQRKEAPDITPLLNAAIDKNVLVGAICAGTLTAARAGLFDNRRHTSNGRDWLLKHARDYKGNHLYQNVNDAIFDKGVVTAPSSAPASFACVMLDHLYPDHPALAKTRTMLANAR